MKVKMNRNAWHVKLQKWTFGHVRLRPNLCPHFWLTIFCVVAAPFVGLFKLFMAALHLVTEPVNNCFSRLERLYEKRKEEKLTIETDALGLDGAYRLWKRFGMYSYCFHSGNTHQLDLLNKFKYINPNWKEMFAAHETELEESFARWCDAQDRAADEARRRSDLREKRLNQVALYTKWFFTGFFWVFIVSLVISVVTLISLAFYKLYVCFWLIPWTTVLNITGIVFAVIFLGYCLGRLVSFLVGRSVEREMCRPRVDKGPGLLSMYYKAAKDNYCPGIDWED